MGDDVGEFDVEGFVVVGVVGVSVAVGAEGDDVFGLVGASVGEELDLKVISLDPEERRIGLSLKEAKTDQEQSVINRYMEGQHGDRTTLADLMDRSNVSIGFGPESDQDNRAGTPANDSKAHAASEQDDEKLSKFEQIDTPPEDSESSASEDEVSDETKGGNKEL